MIYSIKGKVIHIETGFAVIETNGVGFKVQISNSTARELKINSEATLFTYMNVREDAIELFGFATQSELSTFKLLISISGVGPKVALAILSSLSSEQIALSVAGNDYKTITIAPGVGPKLAQRIVLELKDKVKGIISDPKQGGGVIAPSGKISQAVSALAVLGYSAAEVTPVLSKLSQDLSVQDMIKETLKAMKKG